MRSGESEPAPVEAGDLGPWLQPTPARGDRRAPGQLPGGPGTKWTDWWPGSPARRGPCTSPVRGGSAWRDRAATWTSICLHPPQSGASRTSSSNCTTSCSPRGRRGLSRRERPHAEVVLPAARAPRRRPGGRHLHCSNSPREPRPADFTDAESWQAARACVEADRLLEVADRAMPLATFRQVLRAVRAWADGPAGAWQRLGLPGRIPLGPPDRVERPPGRAGTDRHPTAPPAPAPSWPTSSGC